MDGTICSKNSVKPLLNDVLYFKSSSAIHAIPRQNIQETGAILSLSDNQMFNLFLPSQTAELLSSVQLEPGQSNTPHL